MKTLEMKAKLNALVILWCRFYGLKVRKVLNEDFFALELCENGTHSKTGSQAGIPQE